MMRNPDAFPMGTQDTDLVLRLKMLHSGDVYKKVRETVFSRAIPNNLKAKVACCDPQYADTNLKVLNLLIKSLWQCVTVYPPGRGQNVA